MFLYLGLKYVQDDSALNSDSNTAKILSTYLL